MSYKLTQFLLCICIPLLSWSQAAESIQQPEQPRSGPGGADYLHERVVFQDFAKKAKGYWLFEPDEPKPDSAHVVVFMHGYGAYNPMIYGQWIKHLVKKGNIVIFPRYQKDLVFPRPPRFAKNVAIAIRAALGELQTGEHVRPITEPLTFVGHSYGGVIAAKLAVEFEKFSLPTPKGLLLCAPGTGPLTGGRLKSYKKMPEDTKILLMVSEGDKVVGDKMAKRIFETAIHTPDRNLLYQYMDAYGKPEVEAGHNQSYSIDLDFDTGIRNFTAKRALRIARLDAVDYYGYWKLMDALLDCLRRGEHCDLILGGTSQQLFLGNWSDGKAIRPLDVSLPAAQSIKK